MIKLSKVSYVYGKGEASVKALQEVSLHIPKGGYGLITGASGSGKSTLLHVAAGLEPPQAGEVFWDGASLYEKPAEVMQKLRATEIGMVFQFFYLLAHKTVLENVMLPLRYGGQLSSKEQIEKAEDQLEALGIKDLCHRFPTALSGGQKQKVALARALVKKPKALFCDEPTGNLDSASAKMIAREISAFHENGGTVLLVTHSPESFAGATQTFEMMDGALSIK